jgi:TetR/AcrR family transcriptional regulator, transcriptional repressor for nem operon
VARLREFDTDAAVQAAMTAFRRHGYEGTSIQDLVEATGVGRGSLYAAFGSKEGLYLAAIDRYREQYAAPLVELLRSGAPALEVIREVLVAAVDEIVRDGNRLACLIVAAAMERVADDPETARRVRTTTQSLEDALAEIIAAGQDAGELTGQRNARDLARFIVTTLQGLRVMGAISPDRRSLMSAVEVAVGALG